MPYVTLSLIVLAPLVVELVFGRLIPTLWARPRWVVLPLGTLLIGWSLPLGVLPALPYGGAVLTALLGLSAGCLVATLGLFRDTFWTGPTESDIARTGRRSAVSGTVRVRPRP